MKTVAEYEARAKEAARLAAKAITEKERAALHEIADFWRNLAEERRAALGQPPAKR